MNQSIQKIFLVLSLFVLLSSTSLFSQEIKNLKRGSDVFVDEVISELADKRIALVINHSSVLSNGTHLLDTLLQLKKINIKKIFTPEHGFKGSADAGTHISDGVDAASGIPIISLYGKIKKPTKEMLVDVDVIVFHLQDVGSRYYTYLSTLYYLIEAAVESNKILIILDNPNPINGSQIEGVILENEFKSFVGIFPIPIRHGMTYGELAKFFIGEDSKFKNTNVDLEVVKLRGWERTNYIDEYNIDWIPPSPNINYLETAIVYPGTCLIEGTNISEGRGTYFPFLIIGAPFINSDELISEINKYSLSGFSFEKIQFTPESIEGMSTSPKYLGEICNGLKISIVDRDKFNAVEFGVTLIAAAIKLYPKEFKFIDKFFDRLAGTDKLRKMLLKEKSPNEIIHSWEEEINLYKEKRKKYLLY